MSVRDVSRAWQENAEQWLAWARTPAHDVYFWELNFPAFEQLLPRAGTRTLDVGCGEGRVGRLLAEAGHRVFGIDSSTTLANAARDAGGFAEVVCEDAVAMPWPAAHFDLAYAFMSLHDMADPSRVIDEIARVLSPGGVLCIAIIHPLNRSPEGLEDYFGEHRFTETIERRGLTMTFDGIDRPVETYARALCAAGFVIEALREPRPSQEIAARIGELAPAAKRPYFLHLRCRLTYSRSAP